MMKKLILILTLIFTGLNIAYARDIYVDNKSLCERTRGNWRLFNNNCADSCPSKFEHILCTYHPAFTCDCGENRCWDGGKCVSEKVAKAVFEEKENKQKEERIAELKAVGLDHEGNEILAENTTSVPEQTKQDNNTKPSDNQPVPVPLPQKELIAGSTVEPVEPAPKSMEETIAQQIRDEIKNDPILAKVMEEKQKNCEGQSGKWMEFNNGCADTCGSKISANNICNQSLTFSCKCGGTRCWDGLNSSCVELENFKKNLTIFQN